MEFIVYEGTQPVGDLAMEPHGLYYEITAKIQPSDTVKRLYGITGSDNFYIGIPDRRGELFRRIPRKHVGTPERFVLSDLTPYESWYISESEQKSPASIETNTEQRETANDTMEDTIPVPADVVPTPLTEIENGGEENEISTQNDCTDVDPLLFADLPADYDYGGTGTEETDSPHI